MIKPGAKLRIERLSLSQIIITKFEIRFPDTLNGYIRVLTEHPECDPEPLHVSPSPTHEGMYQLENGFHRFCAAIMTGRRDVVCIVEE